MDKARNYFIEEINQNELMRKKAIKVCRDLNYFEHLLLLATAITGCVSCFCLFSCYSVVGLKMRAINSGIIKIMS